MRSSTRPPIYEALGRVYLIDSNAPQRRAIQEGRIRCRAYTHGAYLGEPLAAEALPGVSGMGYMDMPADQGWVMDLHRNEGVEICYLEAGEMAMSVEGTRHVLRAGSLSVTRPWQLHRHGDPKLPAGRLHWIIMDVGVRRPNQAWTWPSWVVLTRADREELTRRLRELDHPVVPGDRAVKELFRRMGRALDEPAPSISRLGLYLNEVLLAVLEQLRRAGRAPVGEASYARETVDLFLRDLRMNPASLSHPWTLSAMAAGCGMGITTFCAWCRTLTNASPMEYLNRCRLNWAAARLRDAPRERITDIALGCGFNASQYFATQFKRHTGVTPRAWRRRSTGSPASAPGHRPV